jgi:hypothetical protein
LHERSYGVNRVAAQVLGISMPLLITSGLTGYILSSWLLVLVRLLGITRYAPRTYWACTLFGSQRGMAMFGGRVVRALALASFIPLGYAVVFETVGNADVPLGAVLGVAHGIVVGIALPVIARRPRCTDAPHPGLFGWRRGAATPLLLLFVYGVYGAALGWVYVVVLP